MDNKSIGDRLIALREHLGKSQNKMAALLHTYPQTLSKYEKGAVQPNAEFLARVVEETQCTTAWLLLGEGDMFGAQSAEVPKIRLSVVDEFIREFYHDLEEGDDIQIKKILDALQIPFIRIQLNSYLIAAKNDYQKIILNRIPDIYSGLKESKK